MFTLDIKVICWNAFVPLVGMGIGAAQAAIHKLLSILLSLANPPRKGVGCSAVCHSGDFVPSGLLSPEIT